MAVQSALIPRFFPADILRLLENREVARQAKASPAGINDLPIEILGEIFLLARHGSIWITDFGTRKPELRPVQLVLPHVCRLWRFVAFSLPLFWSTFSTARRDLRDVHLTQLVDHWLQHSQHTPLQIYFDRNETPPQGVLAAIFSNSHRWKFVSFGVYVLKAFLALGPQSTPAMQALQVHNPAPIHEMEPYLPLLAAKLQSITTICQLSLQFTMLTTEESRLFLSAVPWERMTHVKLDCYVQLGDCINVLRRCTSAIDIRFPNIKTKTPPTTAVSALCDRVTLRQLKSLTINIDGGSFGDLLLQILCPDLRRLYMREECNRSQESRDSGRRILDEFLRCSPNLDQCIICYAAGPWDTATSLLDLRSLQSVPEVDVRVVEGHGVPPIKSPYRCPAVGLNCTVPHLGWTSREAMAARTHLGRLLAVTDWPTAMWREWRHETDFTWWSQPPYSKAFMGFDAPELYKIYG